MIAANPERLVERSGIPAPNPHPYDGITAGMVLWNEARRLPALLDALQPWFEHIVIVVQESTDGTLQIAQARQRPGDQVVADKHRGTGDASMPLLVRTIRTDWSFIVAGDEMPDEGLLGSLWHAAWSADQERAEGVWVEFESIVEGVPYTEQHGHLRLFRTRIGWPSTMHSRPTASRELWWPRGRIRHERSLDEFLTDYVRYFGMSNGNPSWIAHNRQMLHDACVGVAAVKGWEFVHQMAAWPEVKAIAFPERE